MLQTPFGTGKAELLISGRIFGDKCEIASDLRARFQFDETPGEASKIGVRLIPSIAIFIEERAGDRQNAKRMGWSSFDLRSASREEG